MQRSITKTEHGQGLVEYALLIALIGIVAVAALSATGNSVEDVFERIAAVFQGQESACTPVASAGTKWDPSPTNSFWKGGIAQEGDGYQVCPLCIGMLPGYTDSDYRLDLSGVQVTNTKSSWNGYGVAFRSEYGPKGLNGYMFEIERQNKNAATEIYFSKWINGKQIKIPEALVTLPAGIDWNNPPDMSIAVEGDTFTAYLDGKQILQTRDTTYRSGGVGVLANDGTQLDFSDFQAKPSTCEEVP